MTQAPVQTGEKSLVDAILAGEISLDDALTQYRPPTNIERGATFAGVLARSVGDAYRSGSSAELRLIERGLSLVGLDGAAETMRGFADYVAPGGDLGKDVAEAAGKGIFGTGSPMVAYLADPHVPAAAQNDSEVWKAFTQYLPEGLGSSVGMLALPGPKGLGGVAGRGAFVGAGQQFVEAKAHGADDATAWAAFAGGALLGATEAGLPGKLATPIGKLLERGDKASGGGLTDALKEWIYGGAKEFSQETLQSLGENVLAGVLYDEDRKLIQGVLEAGTGGALTGLLVGALAGGARGLANRTAPDQSADAGGASADVRTSPADVQGQQPEQRSEPVDVAALSPAAVQAAQDLGVDPATLEQAPEGIREYVQKRGGEVYIARGAKKAGAIREGAMVVSDTAEGLDAIVDHEVAHLAFRRDPEAAAKFTGALDALAPEMRAQAREDYLQDALTAKRQELDRDLTPEEELATRAEAAPAEDEALAVIAQDFSGLVRLLRTNPEAFAKLKDPSAWRSLVAGVRDFGKAVTFQDAHPDLEQTYEALAGRGYAATVEPKVGVGIAKALGSYLDSLVGKVPAQPTTQVNEQAETLPTDVGAVAEVAPESAPEPTRAAVEREYVEAVAAKDDARAKDALSKLDGPSFALHRRAFPTSRGARIDWTTKDQILRVAQDAWRPVGRWRDALAAAGKVTDANDIILMEELRRGGTLARVKDESANHVAPLREALLNGPVTLDEAGTYLLARAAPERNTMIEARTGQKDGSGISTADAFTITDKAEKGPHAAKYAEIAAAFDRLTQRKLEIMEQSGLITPEAAADLRAQEPRYAPHKSDERAELLYGEKERVTVGIGRTRRKEFKSALGRGSQADNPIIFATMDLMAAIERGTWNDTVGRSLLDLARVVADPKVVTVDRVPTKKALVNGKVQDVPDLAEKANEIIVKENGVARVVRFGKGWETVAQAIKGSDKETGSVAVDYLIRRPTRALASLSTSWNPAFWPVNFARDLLTAGLHATGELGHADAMKIVHPRAVGRAFHEAAADGPWMQRFTRSGGPISFLDLARTFEEEMKRTVREITPPKGPWQVTRRTASKVRAAIEHAGNIFENSTRLSAFRYLVEEKGWSDARAAQFAKNLTTNFEKRGSAAWMNSYYAFSNAGVQGTSKAIKVIRSPWGQRLAAGMVVGGFVMSLMNRTFGGEDEDGVPRWDKVPDWQRRTNATMTLPGGVKLSLPLPFVWNIFFAAGTETERAMFGGQDGLDTIQNLASTFAGVLNPLGGEGDVLNTLAPTLADPLLQLAKNEDYAGRAIFPEDYGQKKNDSQLAWETTSPWLVSAARKMNELSGGDAGRPGLVDVSPASLEFMAKQMFGGVGAEGSRVMRLAEKIISGEDVEWQDVPAVRRFVGSIGLPEIRDYYRRQAELVRRQVEREKAGEPYDRDLWRLRKRVDHWNERIGDLHDELRKPESDKDAIRAELRALYLEATGEIRGESREPALEARK